MESKKNLWGCGGYPSPSICNSNKKKKKKKKKKRSIISKKKDYSGTNTSSPSAADHVNLATSVIKYVKKRCSSFTTVVNKRKNQKAQSQEKKKPKKKKQHHPHQRRKHSAVDVVTLKDWMLESSADVSAGSSGEFIVFMQSAFKKMHPNQDDDDFGKVSIKKSYYSMDHMDKLNSVGSGDGVDGVREGESGGASASLQPPPCLSSEDDKGRKRVSFMLPLVTNVYVLDSADHTKED